ncbi:MAG: flavodoxin domain-containing protein [Anaerolineales bacterium]|nr:flavodoxin domain-containing protein [Anaerolineales bacterium]
MDKQVLVTYASKHGGTAGIAKKIGQVLAESGLQVDVVATKQVKELASYGAVVLGSGVYIGKWVKDALKFAQANESALAAVPVWFFSSGPTGEGDPVELLKGWRIPSDLQPLADRIQPRDMAVFHGVVDVTMLNFIEKFMIKQVNSPVGDFRDWDAITAWAETIAGALNE